MPNGPGRRRQRRVVVVVDSGRQAQWRNRVSEFVEVGRVGERMRGLRGEYVGRGAEGTLVAVVVIDKDAVVARVAGAGETIRAALFGRGDDERLGEEEMSKKLDSKGKRTRENAPLSSKTSTQPRHRAGNDVSSSTRQTTRCISCNDPPSSRGPIPARCSRQSRDTRRPPLLPLSAPPERKAR